MYNDLFNKHVCIFTNEFNAIKTELLKFDKSNFKFINDKKYMLKKTTFTNNIFNSIKNILENCITFTNEVIVDNYIIFEELYFLDTCKNIPYNSNFTIYKPYKLIINLNNTSVYKKITKIDYCSTVINTNNDCIVDKSIKVTHKNKNNCMCKLAFINILLKINNNNIYSTLYNNKIINFYNIENNKLFCYCKIFVDNPFTNIDNFGCIVYKDGSCCLVNIYNNVIKNLRIQNSFEELCAGVCFNDKYYLSNDDNKNVAWLFLEKQTNKWIPDITIDKDITFLNHIINIDFSKIPINYYVLTCRYEDEVEDIIFKIQKVFFNM
ncbi:IL-1 receptor antagonist [Hypsugopox virus]|nr:IL-1 receptor antagonist [Hypsugopox virus]